MPVTKPIPIRLEPEIIAALDGAAEALGTNRAALVRHLVTTFLRHYDAGAGTLPADWRRMLADEERASGPRPAQPTGRVSYCPPAPAAVAMNDGAASSRLSVQAAVDKLEADTLAKTRKARRP